MERYQSKSTVALFLGLYKLVLLYFCHKHGYILLSGKQFIQIQFWNLALMGRGVITKCEIDGKISQFFFHITKCTLKHKLQFHQTHNVSHRDMLIS